MAEVNPNRVSRRSFLRMVSGGALAGAFAGGALGLRARELNDEVVGLAWEKFSDIVEDEYKVNAFLHVSVPLLVDSALRMEPDLSTELQENPKRVPLVRLIDLGVKEYGKRVFFKPSQDIFTEQEFIEIIEVNKNTLSKSAKQITAEDIVSWVKGEGNIEDENIKRLSDFLAAAKWSILDNTSIRAGADYSKTGDVLDYDSQSGIATSARTKFSDRGDQKDYIEMEFVQTFDFIKKRSIRTGERVSTSTILAYYLEKNTGNLGMAIYDTAIFLKVLARNDLSEIDYLANNPEFYKELCDRFSFIEDEFSLIGTDFGLPIAIKTGSYDDSKNKDKSMINQIGLAYHQWFMAALLSVMDIVPIKVSTVGSQLLEINSAQGRAKTASDYKTLLELSSTEKYIKSFTI